MQSAAAGGLRKRNEFQRLQRTPHHVRGTDHLLPPDVFPRVQVDHDSIGPLDIVDRAVPESLIFYIYGSTLAGFVEWARCENPNMDADKMDKIFHKVVNLKIRD